MPAHSLRYYAINGWPRDAVACLSLLPYMQKLTSRFKPRKSALHPGSIGQHNLSFRFEEVHGRCSLGRNKNIQNQEGGGDENGSDQ